MLQEIIVLGEVALVGYVTTPITVAVTPIMMAILVMGQETVMLTQVTLGVVPILIVAVAALEIVLDITNVI